MDNIKAWTGLSVEESVRMTEINGESTSMVWPTVGSRTPKEQNESGAGLALAATNSCTTTITRTLSAQVKPSSKQATATLPASFLNALAVLIMSPVAHTMDSGHMMAD